MSYSRKGIISSKDHWARPDNYILDKVTDVEVLEDRNDTFLLKGKGVALYILKENVTFINDNKINRLLYKLED